MGKKDTTKKTKSTSKKQEARKPNKKGKHLVIVESPAKAKALKKFLGPKYKIEASMGHVRDLPKSTLGVDIENDFEPKYITIRGKGELLAKLRREAKKANKIYLATDPDREGESISWHLMHSLYLIDEDVLRITFNEITESAVKKAVAEPRGLDYELIDAQQARRVLDRIVGYKISPLLWKKVRKGLSAGRVQSVALRIICDREEEIENFVPEEYWSIDANIDHEEKPFIANFYGDKKEKMELSSEEEVNKIVEAVKDELFIVDHVRKGKRVRRPQPPFITSSLQQEASKSLGFSAAKTMQIAQQLYEGVEIKGRGLEGLVTYIRTDSFRVSDEAYLASKEYIKEEFGEKYVPKEQNEYKTKGRAEDAHESIRPTSLLEPKEIKSYLSRDQYRLYTLIWERYLASQMTEAEYDTISVRLMANDYQFRASGSILTFDGHLKAFKGQKPDAKTGSDIPALEKGMELKAKEILPEQHFTQPPARYTEAMLVRTLEENGVGRPSTYAPTISTLTYRHYVERDGRSFKPTDLGIIVNDIMLENFEEIVDIEFTARMEENLDEVEDGDLEWKQIIRDFYGPFEEKVIKAEENIEEVEIEDEVTDFKCSKCGKNMVVKYGRYGKFLACPGFPECKNTMAYFEDANVPCPKCGKRILIKKSRKGRTYYGCEDTEDCNFMTWYLPTGEDCPKCGSHLEVRGRKNKKIHCSNKECDFVKDFEEEVQKKEA